jgi:tRNA dimethylallyltransferase
VAKPTDAELATAFHYFISSHSITEEITAADFEKYALKAVEEVFRERDVAIMVGGTGLYIKAFAEGLDDIPPVDPEVRKGLISCYGEAGLNWLQEEVRQKDPLYFAHGETQNPQRMLRALEVKMSTGKSILEFRTKGKKERAFRIVKVGLELPREKLYHQINHRVDQMMASGLLKEAEALLPFKNLNALQTVGYRELFDYFDGLITLDRAVALIKQNSRHYAKRQLTWFKKDGEIKWIDMRNPGDAIPSITNYAGIGKLQ